MENISPPPPPSLAYQISPTLLLIILLLAVIFFLSGLLHLLIRYLLRPSPRPPPDLDSHSVTALQGNLRQLFHLHDSGVDQSFIDTLPVFPYHSIIGLNDPFDCAVCLSEFEPLHLLRLLPNCSHAFHTHCIDTWLLSHSTCPLCRDQLRSSDLSSSAPVVCVLEAGAESFRDAAQESNRFSEIDLGKSSEIELDELANSRIVTVKLGKFRNVDNTADEDGNKNVNSRRCFSMESFAYILDETTSLRVPIKAKKPGHRSAVSEYGADSRAESFSISKIWRRSGELKKKGEGGDSSKRTFSFRFPVRQRGSSGRAESVVSAAAEQLQCGEIQWWENDEETQSVESMGMSKRRTLMWLMGRNQNNNKVVHSSFPTNV